MNIVKTPEELAHWIISHPGHRIIGIVGPPGSGKSTIATELSRHLGIPHCLVPMDGFHYPQATLRELGRRERMGAPDTFDTGALAELLAQVKDRTKPVTFPEFDRTIEEPIPGSITVMPEHEVVVLEGNYLLVDDTDWSRIGGLLDLSVYVEIPEDLRLHRLTQRHIDFGKSMAAATEWVMRVDEANARVIEDTRPKATVLYKPEE
jgi:pantothenate kinase